MKRWLTVVAGSIALVALWGLPPSAARVPRPNTLPEVIHLEEVTRELARNHAALRALRWSDSLSAIVVGTAAEGVVLSPPITARLEPEAVRRWMDAQHEALARLPRRDPNMRVGVFWVPMDQSTLDDVPLMDGMTALTFVGERDGVPYCFRTLPHVEGFAPISSPASDLGACRLFAAYGTPGARIHAWLEASSLGFARVPVATFAADYARTAQPPIEGASRLFGLSRPRVPDESLTVQACLAGRPAACERAVTDPALIAPSRPAEAWLLAMTPASGFDSYHGAPPFGVLDDALLYEWEARYGSDAFTRFWTSSERVPQAFDAAFGEPLGEWVREWVGQHVGLYRAGPSLPWRSVWASVLVLAGLAGGATAAGMRREVGGG
jgi:hypothetical protein